VRRNYDGFAGLDVGLETLQPVSAGSFEAIEIQDSFAGKHTRGRSSVSSGPLNFHPLTVGQKYPDRWKAPKPYLRIVPQPK